MSTPQSIPDSPKLLCKRLAARIRANKAIFEIEETLPSGSNERYAFYRARIVLGDAWTALENSENLEELS